MTAVFMDPWKTVGRRTVSLVLAILVVASGFLLGTVKAYADETKLPKSAPTAGFGNALSFGGSGGVTLNKGIVLDSAYTEEAWIYPKSSEDDDFNGIITSSDDNAQNRAPTVYVYQKTRIHAGFGDGASWNSVVTDSCLTTDAWNHVAVVFDGSTIQVYVNGNPVKLTMSKDSSAVTSFHTTPYPGSSIKYLGNGLNGKIDEVRIWNAALSQQQIRDGMSRTADEDDIKSGHLVGSWNFNESDGETTGGTNGGIPNDDLTGTLSSGVSRSVSDIPLKYTVQKGGNTAVTLFGTSGDEDGNALSYEITSGPQHGTLTENAPGVYEYRNDGTSLENDSFTYRVNDGALKSENSVKVELSVSGMTAQQGSSSGDYVSLNWKGLPFGRYMVRKKSADHEEFQSIPLKKSIKVLNVYPDIEGSDNLKTWMEDNGFGTVNDYTMSVDKIGLNTFNTDYNNWLKDENGNYQYDVVYFGGWDSNHDEDLSEDAEAAVKKFIDYGGGCLLGHDTVDGSTDRHFIPLAKEYLNMVLDKEFGFYGDKDGTSTLAIAKKGMLTDYPHDLGGVGTKLTVPASHSTYQFATSDIWMKYLTDSFYTPKTPEITTLDDNGTEYGGTNNFYLTTKNNVAMIQTGHSNGEASDDEKSILANTLFYLAQVSTGTSFDDHTAQDVAAPEKITSVSASTDKDTKDTTISFHAPNDNGSTYEYQLDAFDCLGNKTESDPVQATVTTGIDGYKIIVDQNKANPADSDFAGVEKQSGTVFTVSDLTAGFNYIHIRTFDKAGNYSDSTVTFQAENHAPQIVKRGSTNMLNFGGKDQYVSVKDDFQLNGSFTFEAWVNVQQPNRFSRFFDFGNGTGIYNQWLGFDDTSGKIKFELFDDNGERNNITTSECFPLKQWVYVTAVFDKSAGKGTIYLNGDEKADGTLPASISSAARAYNYFGRSNWSDDQYLDGSMYGIKIWKTARSQTEVQSDMNSVPTGNETGLAAYYPLTEQNGSTTVSNIKGGDTGVLHGVTFPDFTYAVSATKNSSAAVGELEVEDPDAGSGNMTLNLSTSQGGTLNFDDAGGTEITDNGTSSVTVNGTLSGINSALRSLQYRPKNDYLGSDTINAKISDNGNTGEGGSLSDMKNVEVTINSRTGKSVLSTAVGTLSGNTIQNIPCSVTASELKKALTLSDGAAAGVILAGDGSAVSDRTAVNSAMAVRVTAEDGSHTDYPVAVLPGIAVAGSGQALQFDGVDDYADIAENSAFATGNFTVEGWMQYTEKQGWNGVIDKGRDNSTDWYILTAGDDSIGIVAGMPGAELEYNWDDTNWHYVSITYDGTCFALYIDGQIKKTAEVSSYNATNNRISFGRRQAEYDGGSLNRRYYKGSLDEVRIWSTARTSEEINRDMDAGSAGDEQGLPGYWKMDLNAGGLLKNYGSADSADGTVSGASYVMSGAWQNRSTDKNTELTIDAGYVTDGGIPAVAVQSNPQHGTLRVDAGKIIYMPEKDYFGSDLFAYTVTNTVSNHVASYSVNVTINSKADTPVISDLPASQTVAVGGSATFNAAAAVTDGGALTYQWERSTDGGNTWQAVDGATGSTYTTPKLGDSDNGSKYRCKVTNTKDGVKKTTASAPSELTVTAAPQEPAIPAQPTPGPVAVGGSATFNAAAAVTDGGALTYQWERSTDGGNTWQAVDGATGGTYTTPKLGDSDNGSKYRCKVTNTKDGVSVSTVTGPKTVTVYHAVSSDNSGNSSSSENSGTKTVTAKADGVVSNENTAEINTSVTIGGDEISAPQGDSAVKTVVVVNLPTDVVKQELEAKKNVSLNVSVPYAASAEQKNSLKINVSAEMIRTAKDNGRDLTISVYDAETRRRAYRWQFKGEDLAKSSVEVKDIDITMSVHKIAEVPPVNAVSPQKNGLVLSFDYSGLLPSAADVKISAAEKGFKPGDRLLFYYFNSAANRLESTGSQYTVDENGDITVKISHCSDYVLMPILPAPQKSGNVLKLDTTIRYNMYTGGNYYFLALTNKKVSVSARAADSSVLKVKLIDAKSKRGWYFEITGLKAGSTDVIVTASDGSAGSFPVTVKSGKMILDTSSCTLPANSLYDISAKIFGSGAGRLRAVASDRKVASVIRLRNGHYQVRALSPGTAKIIFEAVDGKGKVVAAAYTLIHVAKVKKRFGNSARVTVFY